jgi:parvulin-like peptidyl-prolyl isomerase
VSERGERCDGARATGREPSPFAVGLVAVGLVVVVLAGGGCPSDPRQRDNRPVATAGPVVIEQHDVLALLARRGVARIAGREERLAVARQLLDHYIDEELILAAAAKAGITVEPDAVEREIQARTAGYPPGMFLRVLGSEQLTLDAFREGVRRRMIQDAFLRARLSGLAPVTDGDVEAAWKQRWANKTRPAQVRARQVLLRTAEEATHVVELIRSRQLTVEQAAARFSQGLEAQDGGDLGWFAIGDLPKVFEVCFVLEPGVVSDPVASEYGHHIFQVIEKRDERVEPLTVVHDTIYAELLAERQAAAGEALLGTLRAEHPISVSRSTLEAVVALLPPPPAASTLEATPGLGRSLDSHSQGQDPIPPLPRE